MDKRNHKFCLIGPFFPQLKEIWEHFSNLSQLYSMLSSWVEHAFIPFFECSHILGDASHWLPFLGMESCSYDSQGPGSTWISSLRVPQTSTTLEPSPSSFFHDPYPHNEDFPLPIGNLLCLGAYYQNIFHLSLLCAFHQRKHLPFEEKKENMMEYFLGIPLILAENQF